MYKYRIWCTDCVYKDYYGCFGGLIEDSEEEFTTIEGADIAGNKYTEGCSIWDYDIIDLESKEIVQQPKKTVWV